VLFLVAYIATIFAANWAIQQFGPVPVGFGLMAPAGVYFAGLAFTLRDLTQERLGRRAVVLAIVVGALVSAVAPYVISLGALDMTPVRIALASAAAFLVSEMADFAVYTPLRARNWLGAVLASNVVGLVVDSALFLSLAFGSLEFLPGQIVGKAGMTLLAIVILWAVRRRAVAPDRT
jgi:uncharacterized PurR-regulated membrane protein YhhQ (DUF165 family)